MNPLSSYQQRYRLHQAYSRYPKLSFLTDIAKTVCLCGFVAITAWFGFVVTTYSGSNTPQAIAHNSDNHASTMTGDAMPEKEISAVAANSAQPDTLTGDIEIPAVASTTDSNSTSGSSRSVLSTDEKKIYESDWVFLLPEDKFIIQFGSSSDRALVYEEANAFPTGPVAVYPFKKTRSKKLVYGYSSGVYNSLDDARRALDAMPKKLQAQGPWIRPVGLLQKQIMQLSVDS